jgi:hypothetical protein
MNSFKCLDKESLPGSWTSERKHVHTSFLKTAPNNALGAKRKAASSQRLGKSATA